MTNESTNTNDAGIAGDAVAPYQPIVIPPIAPFYEQDGVTIYVGDCRDILPRLQSVDAIITDPPYNVGYEYGEDVDDNQTESDYQGWCHSWFWWCKRKSNRIAVSPGIANLGTWHKIEQPDWVLCWHKPAAMGRCRFGFSNWEPVIAYGKPAKAKNDVFQATIKPDPSIDGHPCPKPLKWGQELVAMFSDEGDTVLDPFAGSGTVLVAAKYSGRKAIGIEINEEYAKIAAKRLEQGTLF